MGPLTTTALTMSSREIAELTGKRHADVMRDIRSMLENLAENTERSFAFSYQDSTGRTLPCFHLPKRETIILVSGYDVTMRARIIDRWLELEALDTARPSVDPILVLNDPAAMRGLLLTYSEKVLTLEADRAAMLPKVEAHDRIAESFGSVCRRIAAKNLGIPPLVLNRWMRTNGWTYTLQGGKDDLAYQSKMMAGYLEHKVETGERPDGTSWTRTSVRVTPKGMLALAKAFPPAASAVKVEEPTADLLSTAKTERAA